jgi:hypothetical protein
MNGITSVRWRLTLGSMPLISWGPVTETSWIDNANRSYETNTYLVERNMEWYWLTGTSSGINNWNYPISYIATTLWTSLEYISDGIRKRRSNSELLNVRKIYQNLLGSGEPFVWPHLETLRTVAYTMPVPLLTLDTIDVRSLNRTQWDWRAMLHGAVVSKRILLRVISGYMSQTRKLPRTGNWKYNNTTQQYSCYYYVRECCGERRTHLISGLR